jgi:biopolymer transport protein ExbB
MIPMSLQKHFRPLTASLAAWAFSASAALAQAPATGETAPASRSLFSLIYEDGGILMYPLTLCSMAVVGLAVFQGMSLARSKFFSHDLEDRLRDHMQAARVRSAIDAAASSPTYLGRLAAASLKEVDGSDQVTLGQDKVEEAMADFVAAENRQYFKWLGYFSLLAQISPMIGLLGTVQGMIGAFANLKHSSKDPGILANNISVALYTTAAGLIIAIPSVLIYYFFKNKLSAHVAECVESVRRLLADVQEALNPGRQEKLIPEGL